MAEEPKPKRPKPNPATRVCYECRKPLQVDAFSNTQLRKHGKQACCKACCVKRLSPVDNSSIGLFCHGGCQEQKKKKSFPVEERDKPQPKCKACVHREAQAASNLLVCRGCEERKKKKYFPMEEREKSQPKCKACISQELHAPRECSVCHENKTQGKYSEKQWRDLANGGRKCLDCFSEAQEEWLEAKAACLKARDLGYQSYSFPREGHAAFDYAKEAPDVAGLVGTYDILYHHNGGLEGAAEQRTTRGCLTLQRNEKGQLVGSVVRSKGTPPSKADIFGIDYTFQEDYHVIDGHGWRMDCLTTSVDSERSKRILALHHINFPSMRKPLRVMISPIISRTALPWRCQEYWCSDHQTELNVSFETLGEADDITERFNDFSKSWICNHLELDDSIARRIHEFVAWRPVPAFFVEPKDLFITTVWWDSMHFHSESNFIARRRT